MDLSAKVQFFLKTKVRLANGAFETVGAEAASLGHTVLVVTGRTAMRRAGFTEKLVKQIEAAGARAVLYENASPNPTTDEVDAGASLARREGADVVVGLGGGSAVDVAKAIAITVPYNKPCHELCNADLPTPGLPVIAVPTTSGTGAEVTSVAVITVPSRRYKTALRSVHIVPTLAIVDPELTVTMPPEVTASSGMDALAHAVESYISKKADPFAELFAERATELALTYLKAACEDGAELMARTSMALASLMAGVALSQAGVVLGHGAGMALGGLFGTDHGTTVGLLLPEVLEFNLSVAEARLAALAKRSGVVTAGTNGLSDVEAAQMFIRAIRNLIKEIPLPAGLAAMGCNFSDKPLLVERVVKQAATLNNPKPVNETEAEDFLRRVIV